jgi:hypothetical protein
MRNLADDHIHFNSSAQSRRPLLTAIIVYSVGLAVAVLMAVLAVWRAPSGLTPRSLAGLYVVHVVQTPSEPSSQWSIV